jgi:hypothetical protein
MRGLPGPTPPVIPGELRLSADGQGSGRDCKRPTRHGPTKKCRRSWTLRLGSSHRTEELGAWAPAHATMKAE